MSQNILKKKINPDLNFLHANFNSTQNIRQGVTWWELFFLQLSLPSLVKDLREYFDSTAGNPPGLWRA